MSQRNSEYARQPNDLYETPAWVTEALLPHLYPLSRVWEPAAGSGKMVDVLISAGFTTIGTTLEDGLDFLQTKSLPLLNVDTIITNPPFRQAQRFIEHALELIKPVQGVVAMLLRVDYDSAKTRNHLFGCCPLFAKKVVLTRRIVWFDRPGAAPSFNHAWYIWSYQHSGPPVLGYS